MVQARPFVTHRTAARSGPGEFTWGSRRSKWMWSSILSEFLRFSPNIRHSTVAPLTYAVTQTRIHIITSSWLHLSGRLAADRVKCLRIVRRLCLTLRRLMSYIYIYIYIYMEHPFLMFLDHTQWRSTVGRTPLDEWSARRRDLYLTTHDTHNRQISMPPVGFEPTISAGELPQTLDLP